MKHRHDTAGFEDRHGRTAMSDFEIIKDRARGHWTGIIGGLYPALIPAMGRPGQSRCTCPVHGSSKARGDGFRVFRDFPETGGAVCNTCGTFPGGIDLIMWLEGCDAIGALRIVEGYLGIDNARGHTASPRTLRPPAAPPVPEHTEEDIAQREKVLADIWAESLPLASLPDDHQAIRYYTQTRGIGSADFVRAQRLIRFHPRLYYRTREEAPRRLPGLVSMFHGSCGTSLGLHRTYLAPDAPAKADVMKVKKVLKRHDMRLNGGIRLFGREPFTGHINLCEGKETGLAISWATGKSVIATTTTSLMAAWQPMDGVHHVTIWADADETHVCPNGQVIEAGLHNARKLQARLAEQGIRSRILLPELHDGKKSDWNDVLLRDGPDGIAGYYSSVFG